MSVTWSAGYPKCYSFTVSHSTQDGSINVTQPADSDTSHTLTSLQPGTTYRIGVEALRKGGGADGQRVKVMGNFTTEDEGEDRMLQTSMQFVAASFTIRACGCSKYKFREARWVLLDYAIYTEHIRREASEAFCQLSNSLPHHIIPPYTHITEITDTTDIVPSKTIIPTTTLPPRPSASSETVGELTLCV